MIKIGLLGAARIAPLAIIAPVARRNDCEIIAVGCRDVDKGRVFCQDNALVARTGTYAEICDAPDIDMIYCALPPSAHLEWVTRALEAGKSVLCEKPISMGESDARTMADTAEHMGRPLMEAFHYYFHPVSARIRQAVLGGEIGTPVKAEGVFTAAIPPTPGQLRHIPELGGGALMDLGCYPLHMARSLLGEPDIISVDADIENGVDVYVKAELDCAGVPFTLLTDMRLGVERHTGLEVIGTKGRLTIKGCVGVHFHHELVIDTGEKRETISGTTQLSTYDYQLEHFIDVINGATPALPPSDFTAQMRAIEHIYKQVNLR